MSQAENREDGSKREPGGPTSIPTLTPPPGETIAGITDALRAGRRSCLDVLESCLARIDEWEPRVHAWVVVDREGARDQARARDEEIAAGQWRGTLHGVPVGIKDIIDVEGLPTACGSGRRDDRRAGRDAEIVGRLRGEGAVVVGKTVTTAYAWIDPPRTRNPWDLGRTPGGSSSGSAAALACGMVPAAIGSQTGGSITRPAAFCGVAGLKPTFGRLPIGGIQPLAPSLDHPGPMARSVGDLATIWRVLAGTDPRDNPDTAREGPIRIGRLGGMFRERAVPEASEATERAIGAWERAGAVVREAELPGSFDEVIRNHRLILATEAARVHRERLDEAPDEYPPLIRSLVEEGRAVPATVYDDARRHQGRMTRDILACFEGVDVLVTPATIGPAPGPETTGDPLFNSPWSYTGLPTVSFPVGLAPGGLPMAIQFVGRPFGEAGLLAVAGWCEGVIRGQRGEGG